MWSYLKNIKKPILLYGMGNNADRVLDILEKEQIKVSGVFASDGFVRGHSFRGFKVISYSEAKEIYGDMVVLLCFGSQRPDVMENIIRIAREQELYVPDLPVCGDTVFTSDYYSAHKNQLDTVYNMLADDRSKEVFNDIIEFKLSGKIDSLLRCQSSSQEAFENILKLGRDEIFMDLGAYNGDTVREFLGITQGKYQKIYAVEPDKKNFASLLKKTSAVEKIEYINAGIDSKKGQQMFSMKAGRSSVLSSEGVLIPTESIDNILSGNPVTYIKMDVEGQELNAIEGGKNTILKYKPKMLVSAYHRTEDLFTLPLKVMEIRDDYKIYMRHYPYIPAWDTNYYFV